MIYRFEKGNLNQLEYWFDGKKMTEAAVKQKFQQLFQNTTIPAGKTVSPQTEVFETIWNNPNFDKSTLFGNEIRPNFALNIFINLANDLNSVLYSFIKVK